MDVVMLSRLQFAVATVFHFLFVPLTIGLSVLIAVMETQYVRSGDPRYRRLARFWGRIFLINFVVGVVTGLTLEFQFGTNWSRYSAYVGDVFGSLLAIEATTSFFLESTFVAVWAFGWKRLSPKMHAVSIWLVAAASVLSSFWILIANAWMQSPVGYAIRNGRAELTDFWAVVTQRFAILEIAHTITAAFVVGSFVVMGVSAYQILRKHQVSTFITSFRIGLVAAVISAVLVVASGHFSGEEVARTQPAKLAAMESHWSTQPRAKIDLLLIPEPENERNSVEMFKVPAALSMLAFRDPNAEVVGLKDIPKADRPPVRTVFFSFRLMVLLGVVFIVLTVMGIGRWHRLERSRRYLRVMLWAIPLPYIACELGWIVAEVGRQPWIVWQVMRTQDAASTSISAGQVAVSLAAFVGVYSLVGLAAVFLMVKSIRKGLPEA